MGAKVGQDGNGESSILPEAESVYASLLGRVERGEPGDLEELCRAHPALAAELRRLDDERRRFRARAGGFGLGRHVGEVDAEERELERLLALLRGRSPSVWPYVVAEPLGEGSFGTVHAAEEPALTRRVALKVLKPKPGPAAHQLDRLERFLAEARILSRLGHPGIVALHAIGLDPEQRPFFAMQLVEGRDFGDVIRLARAGRDGWTLYRALEELLTVCDALAFAHGRGIVHRDVKPSNVRVAKVGETYVMDWGLARVEDGSIREVGSTEPGEASSPSIPGGTEQGAALGTARYMSPEQARGRREEVGPSSDVYSMGAILYHLLSGRPPYAELEVVTPARVMLQPARSVRELAPGAPPELLSICKTAMQRDPGARYASMNALAEDLRAFLENRVVHAHRTGPLVVLTKWAARNRKLAGATAAVIVLSLVSLFSFREVRAAKRRTQAETERGKTSDFVHKIEALLYDRPLASYGNELAWKDADYERYVRDVRAQFASLGAPLGERPPDELFRVLRARLDDRQMSSVLEVLYGLSMTLTAASRDRLWSKDPQAPWTLALLDGDTTWQGTVGLIDAIEPDVWRRGVWKDFLEGALGSRTIEAASLAALTGTQLEWLGELIRTDRGEEAKALYLKAVELDPGLFLSHFQLGLYGGKKDGLDQKLHHHGVAVALRPDSSYAWYSLGWDYHNAAGALTDERERQRFQEIARDCYLRAIEINPDFERPHANVSILLPKQEGIARLRKFLAMHEPTEDLIFVNLAFLCLETGDREGAIEAARRGITMDPKRAVHHFHLARGLTDLGRQEEALEFYEEAARLDPKLWLAFTNVAAIRLQRAMELSPGAEATPESLEEVALALEAAEAAKTVKPDAREVWVNLGAAHSWREELDEAVDAFERAQQLGYDARPYFVGIRDALVQRGTRPDLVQRIAGILSAIQPP